MDPDLVPPDAEVIVHAPDREAVDMERELVERTDNGWIDGDPLEQPDNPEAAREYG